MKAVPGKSVTVGWKATSNQISWGWGFIVVFCSLVVPFNYSKTCVKRPLSKRPKIGFLDQLLHNTGQMYCRMLQSEHSEILFTFLKIPFIIKIFVLSIFKWPFYTGFIVIYISRWYLLKKMHSTFQ